MESSNPTVELNAVMAFLFDNQSAFKEGDYLEIMNTMKSVNDKIERLKSRTSTTITVSARTHSNEIHRLQRTNEQLRSVVSRMQTTIRFYDNRLAEAYDSLSLVQQQTRKLKSALKKKERKFSYTTVDKPSNSVSTIDKGEKLSRKSRVKCNICLKEVSKGYLKKHQQNAICKNNAVNV